MAETSVNVASGLLNVAQIHARKIANEENKKANMEYDAFLKSRYEQEVGAYENVQRVIFNDKEEYQSFVSNAVASGIKGSATLETFNGYYVYETDKSNAEKTEEICRKLEVHTFDDFHKETMSERQEEALYDYYGGMSNSSSVGGVVFQEALKETEELNASLNKAQRLYDFLRDTDSLANPFNKGQVLDKLDQTFDNYYEGVKGAEVDKLVNKTEAMIKQDMDSMYEMGYDGGTIHLMEQNSKMELANSKTDLLRTMDANKGTVAEFTRDFLTKNKDKLPFDAKGNFDLASFSKMSASDLKRLGITEAERAVIVRAMNVAGQNVSALTLMSRPLKRVGYKVMELVEDEDLNEMVGYAHKAKKGVQDIAKVLKSSSDISLKDHLERLRRRTGKNRNIKDVTESLKKKKPKAETRKIATTSKKVSKKKNELANKTYKKLNKRYGMSQNFQNSALGKVFNGVNKAKEYVLTKTVVGKVFSAVLKFVSSTLLTLVGTAVGVLALIVGVVFLFIVLIVSIPSLFNQDDPRTTVVYQLYEHLNDLEEDWTASLKDADNLYSRRKKLKYGRYDKTYEEYIEWHQHLFLRGSKLYITPFDFEPKDEIKYSKEVTGYDGGSIVVYVPNYSIGYDKDFNGGHTSNSKDILCMTDTMFFFDSDNMDDDSIGSLSDNVLIYEFNQYFNDIKNEIKLCGAVISSLWDSNALIDWSESYKPTCHYRNLQTYCDTLFGASHQEMISLDTLFFSVTDGVQYGDLDETYDEAYRDSHLLTACPVDGGCSSAEFICFYDGTETRKFGLEGTDGQMHSVGSGYGANNVVNLDGTACLYQAIVNPSNWTYNYTEGKWYNNSVSDFMKNYIKGNSCWKHNGASTDLAKGGHTVETGGWQSTTVTVPTNTTQLVSTCRVANSPETTFLLIEKTYSQESHSEQVTHTHSEDCEADCDAKVTVWTYRLKTETDTWYWKVNETCEGHHGKYCGGHVAVDVMGVVFSFSDDQIQYALGNDSQTSLTEIIPKVDNIDYTSFATAKQVGESKWNGNTYYEYTKKHEKGLNLVGTTTWLPSAPQITKSDMKYWMQIRTMSSDIFDVDHCIDYGYGFFPIKSYKDYEGWTADNMEIALLKYTNNWGDTYGFDIPENLGIPPLSDSEIKKIIIGVKKYYSDRGVELSDLRVDALRSALENVGNGQYSQMHHGHGYLLYPCTVNHIVTHHCTTTDCSGFLSWHFINNGSTRLSEVGSTDTFLGLKEPDAWNGGNALPADGLIKHREGVDSSGTGGNHALVFVGYVGEDIPLSFGTIKAGDPITIDCSRVEGNGNIYLRNSGLPHPEPYIESRGQGEWANGVWVVKFE